MARKIYKVRVSDSRNFKSEQSEFEAHFLGGNAVPVENPKIVSESCTLLPLK